MSDTQESQQVTSATDVPTGEGTSAFSLREIPAYSGTPYTEVNGNKPYFTEVDLTTQSFETYSELDSLGRCGVAYATIVDGGDCAYGVESTVITLATSTPTLLRPGAVTKEMLEAEIGPIAVAPAVLEKMADGETAASPGMKYKHYAPKAQVILVNGDSAAYAAFVNSQPGCYALCYEEDRVTVPKVPYGKATDDLSQARELFDALRRLDELGAKKVYARMPRKTGVGMAVYNRLIRAAAFRILDLSNT